MADLINALTIATTAMGVAMSLSYYVQIAKILKNKSAKDISLTMFIVFAIGLTLWLLYGLAINNLPLIIVNAISVVGAYILLVLILKYK